MSHLARYLDPELIQRLNHLQLSVRRLLEGAAAGTHRSPARGASSEFRQHRFYTAGDDPRRLDWRVLGRTDRLYIKEYDQETSLRCMIVLDASGSMAYRRLVGSKYDYAARLCIALAYLLLSQGESVGLALAGAPSILHYMEARRGTPQLAQMVEAVQRTGPSGPGDIAAGLRAASTRLGQRSLVIVLSDLFSPATALRDSLARLRHARHEVLLFRVLDRDEQEFPFDAWSQFRGLESESIVMAEPALLRQQYLQRFANHDRKVRAACKTLGVELHTLLTDWAIHEALGAVLRNRQ